MAPRSFPSSATSNNNTRLYWRFLKSISTLIGTGKAGRDPLGQGSFRASFWRFVGIGPRRLPPHALASFWMSGKPKHSWSRSIWASVSSRCVSNNCCNCWEWPPSPFWEAPSARRHPLADIDRSLVFGWFDQWLFLAAESGPRRRTLWGTNRSIADCPNNPLITETHNGNHS